MRRPLPSAWWGYQLILIPALLIGIVAFVGDAVLKDLQKRRIEATRILVRETARLIIEFKDTCGRYPKTSEGIKLLTGPVESCPKWGQPIKELKDPWGQSLVYRASDDDSSFHLSSYGRDGKAGGAGFDRDIEYNE